VRQLSETPFEIPYKRWAHIEAGYIVTILGVYHSSGVHGCYAKVVVKGTRLSKKKQATWSAQVFLQTFKPLGRKLKFKTVWERLLEDDT